MRRLLALSLLLVLAGCDNVVPITSTPTATETGSPATGLPTVQSSVTVAPSYTDTPEPLPVATATPAASATATATPDFHGHTDPTAVWCATGHRLHAAGQ
jgi:hypothetical protein